MSRAIYIHGTEPAEQERLSTLNRLTNAAFLEFLKIQPGMRVLDVGSGLGLLASAVAGSAPNVFVVGLEPSGEQLRSSVRAPGVHYVQGDAHKLQFEDGSFDLVYARFVLEHVANPESVLQEMRRVARSGCAVVACENDESLLRFDPECPAFERVWKAFQHYQQSLGGDSHIGRRLYGLFRRAGLASIELSVQPELHWHGSPGFIPWLTNLIGNVESARKGLISSGLCSEESIAAGIGEVTALFENEQASSVFVWIRALGIA